jgi:AraC family transcriptional regulator
LRYTGSSTFEWPGMVSVYAVLGPHPRVTSTGAHQVGIDFGGHRGLVREIDGRAVRHDAKPGSVYVTGSERDHLARGQGPDRGAGDLSGPGPGRGLEVTAEVRPSFAVRDGVVYAVASLLRRAHPTTGTLTDIEASTLAHLLVRHLLRRYGTGPAPRPAGELRPGAVDVVAKYTRAHLAGEITQDAQPMPADVDRSAPPRPAKSSSHTPPTPS